MYVCIYLFFVCLSALPPYMFVRHVCAWCSQTSEEGPGSFGTGGVDGCEPVLLSAGQSFQPLGLCEAFLDHFFQTLRPRLPFFFFFFLLCWSSPNSLQTGSSICNFCHSYLLQYKLQEGRNICVPSTLMGIPNQDTY